MIAELDELKKSNAAAREASRWLENEAIKGSRTLKFQKESEKLQLELLKYPSRKDKLLFDFYVLLENCNYIIKHKLNVENGDSSLTLLTTDTDRIPNANAICRSVGKLLSNCSACSSSTLFAQECRWKT